MLFALLLAALFRGPLLERVVAFALPRTLGLHVTIAQVGGNVLSGLDLRGVSARREAGAGAVASFGAERVSARYSLAALLRGQAAFLDSLDLTVEGGRLDLDLTGAPAAGSRPGEQPAVRAPLPRLPRLTVRDSRVLVHGRGFTLAVDGLQAAVARADQANEQAVDIRSSRFALRHPALRESPAALAITGRYAPRRLAITAAQVDGASLVKHATLDFGERPEDFELRLALELWAGAIEVAMLRRADGTEVRWDARALDLKPQSVFVNPALGALRGRLSTSGAARLVGGGVSTLAGHISLDWQGAQLAGRAVDHLVVRGSVEQGVAQVNHAEGRIGRNEVDLRQVRLPAAALFEGRWRDLLAAASGSFNASLGDLPAFLALWGVGLGDREAAVPDHRLRLEGSLEQGRIQLARCDLASGLGKVALTAFTIGFPGPDRPWGETSFSGSGAVDIPRLRDVSALLPIPPLSGSLRGEISGTGTFARPEGRASLTGRGIAVDGRIIGDVELLARASAGSVEVETLQVRQGGNRLTVSDVRFDPAALAAPDLGAFFESLDGSFAISFSDLPGLAAVAGVPREKLAMTPAKHLLTASGTVSGRTVSVTGGSFAAAGGSITLRSARVILPGPGADWKQGTTIEGDLEVGIPDLGPIATIFELPPLRGSLKGTARFSGSLGAPGGSGEVSGRGIVIDGHPVGEIVLKAAVRQQRLAIEILEVTRGADRLHGRGSFDLETGKVLAAEADVDLADVAPYLAEFARGGTAVSGRLHVGLRAAGPLPGAPLVIAAEYSGGRIGNSSGVRGVARAQYEPGRLSIGVLELTGSGGLAAKGEGTIPVDLAADGMLSPGPISFRATASIPALEELAFLIPPAYALTGALTADIGVTGSWEAPEVRIEVRGERLLLPAGTRYAPPGPFTLAGTVTWGAAEARAQSVRIESPALAFSLSGAWSSPPSLSSLSSLFAGSGDAAGSLSLRATFASPDIGWLRESVAGLRRLSGSLSGEIAVDGPAGDPVLSGEIRVADGALRYQDLPPIDTLGARATVLRRSVILQEFGGNLGGSPFTLGGSLEFSDPGNPVLDLRLQGKNVLLYRDEGLRVRADSDLTLRGPVSALSLAGEIALTNSLYQKDITVASLFTGGDRKAKRASPGLAGISFPEPPLRDMRFDVRLVAREPFEIRTTVVRGAARPDLRLTGTGLLPILRGPILIDTALVMLPSGTFEIERGTVLMRESDPDRPALDFGGRMQALGYEISAQIGGTLDSPEIVLTSVPPLPREELLLFVVTGAPPGSVGAEGGSFATAASPLAVYFGKNVVGQLLGGKSRAGKPGLQDRIELQIGRELTRGGSVTVDARLLFRKEPVGRGSTLYITSEKDIYDQYNAGLKIVFKFK